MNLLWTFNRLRQMRPAEIAHRVKEAARTRRWRKAPIGWIHEAATPLQPLIGFATRLDSAGPELRAAIRSQAAGLLAGRYGALGAEWPRRPADALFPSALWFLDPISGTSWPDSSTSAFAIDFRGSQGRGDVKYVWEINRLQMLPLLAADCRLNGTTASLTAVEAAIESWHAANPPYGGINWTSGIEVALRAVSLIFTHALLGDSLSARRRDEIAAQLAAARRWLRAFPSLHSSANNHRIAELAGLILIALASGSPDVSAQRELETELLRQILPDGTPAEQSPSYGAFTVELALLCRSALGDCGIGFSAQVAERLAAFAHYAACLGDEALVAAGDDDEGRAISDLAEIGFYSGKIGRLAGAAATNPAAPRDRKDLRDALLGGAVPASPRQEELITFPYGGHSLWRGRIRDRAVRLSFDHGPLGYLSIAAHGHADALSITLSIDGEPILIDPGTYLYGSGGPWRSWFRGTPAHNTLVIDGESQSRMAGPFLWSHKAQTRLIEARDTPLLLSAEHDGYRRRHGVLHRRTLAGEQDGWRLTDCLVGTQPQMAELVFQLAPGLGLAEDAEGLLISQQNAPVLRLRLPPGTLKATAGGPGPSGGWASPRFGLLVPAPRLIWRGRIGPAGVHTLIEVLGRAA